MTPRIGWLKYSGSDVWHRVEVLHVRGYARYTVFKSRTEFFVGPADTLIVVGR